MRSLAKRADDRFASAREMKIILEAALREGDVGLVETQRLGREAVEELRSTPISSDAPARATSLADELEPGTTSPPVIVDRRRRWPWLVLGGVVIASAGAVAYVATHRDHGYESIAHVDGVPIVAGAQFGHVLIETDGKLTPRQIDDELVKALDRMRSAAKQASADLDVIDRVVALPRAKLCDTKLYPKNAMPPDCATVLAAATFSPSGVRIMLIADDASILPDTIRAGVAEAVCVFQPANLGSAEVDKICDALKQFSPH
jgi:hypothetical protein